MDVAVMGGAAMSEAAGEAAAADEGGMLWGVALALTA